MAAGVAAAATVETARLTAEFDDVSGSVVRVSGKGVGVPAFVANGGALWEVELAGGVKLTEKSLVKDGGSVEVARAKDGLLISWSDTNVTLPRRRRTDIDLLTVVGTTRGRYIRLSATKLGPAWLVNNFNLQFGKVTVLFD